MEDSNNQYLKVCSDCGSDKTGIGRWNKPIWYKHPEDILKFLCSKCRFKGDRNGFFNKKHSDETKEILSKVDKSGEKNGMFGRHHTQKTKDIISKIHKGRKQTKKIDYSKRRRRFGPENPMWKGGKKNMKERIRRLKEYVNWRNEVFKRDDYTCLNCGSRNGNGKYIYLEAHHIIEFADLLDIYNIKSVEDAISCKEIWDVENGVTLCKECHDMTKGDYCNFK